MKNRDKNILIVILVLLLSVCFTLVFFAKQESSNLRSELNATVKMYHNSSKKLFEENDKQLKILKENIRLIDSIKGKRLDSKNIDGVYMNNKQISLDELVNLANKQFDEKRLLAYRIRKDSTTIEGLKKIIKELESAKVIKRTSDGGYSFIRNVDSLYQKSIAELQAKNMILNLIKKNYDIDSKVKYENESIIIQLLNTDKLDSALWVYPYYKHKIKTNKKGQTVVR